MKQKLIEKINYLAYYIFSLTLFIVLATTIVTFGFALVCYIFIFIIIPIACLVFSFIF